jgi:hypothetical protein
MGTVRDVIEFSETETRYRVELDADNYFVVSYPSNTRLVAPELRECCQASREQYGEGCHS